MEEAAQDNLLLEQQEEFLEIPTPDFEDTYRNIKHLLFDGFIPVRLNFGPVKMVLKSITPLEFSYIDLVATKPEEKLPLYFLYSTVFLDGIEMIPLRKSLHDDFQELFSKFSSKTFEVISETIGTIQSYYYKSYDDLEGYLYERESRHKWDVYKESALSMGLVGGLKGLGLNTAQEVWVSFNHREDERVAHEIAFSHAKFIASSMVGSKEINRIERVERLRWVEELRRRQDVRLKNKTEKIKLSGPVNTAEELVQELERQIRGELDIHDKIILQHEQNLVEAAEFRRASMGSMKNQMSQAIKESKALMGESKAVTQKEIEEELAKLGNIKVNYNEDYDHYMTKIEQTQKRVGKAAQSVQDSAQKISKQVDKVRKSIFDPEVQKTLKNLGGK